MLKLKKFRDLKLFESKFKQIKYTKFYASHNTTHGKYKINIPFELRMNRLNSIQILV